MKKRIAIFYVNAGGGHSGTARALEKEFREKYADSVEPVLIDAVAGGPFITRWFLEKGYALAVNNFPKNWRAIYWLSKIQSIMRGEDKVFTKTILDNISKKIKEEKFDVIITLHFFLTSPVLNVLQENKLDIPIFSIVTDPFSAPPIWFLNKGIKYFVFSDLAKSIGVENKVPSENITVVSPLINNKFFEIKSKNKNSIKQNLSFPLDKRIILIAAGGDGLYRGDRVLAELTKMPNDYRIVVICGREEKFLRRAKMLQKKFSDKIVAVYGFVDNIEELIYVSDLVVGKAGPATIFESLAVGRPLVLTHYIWEQEKGNCDFVVKNGLGKYESNLDNIANVVKGILENRTEYEEILKKIESLSFSNGVGDIAKKITE